MLYDRARVFVEGGRGGDGVVSFRREAHVPKGGPDGGNGGTGGDVVLVADPSRRDLAALRHGRHLRAGRGGHGQGKRRHGARGEDREVPVPPGTVVEGLDAARFDLVEAGQRAVVAHGGGGGSGNKRFASATRQAPRFAERGLEGESGWIELRLKLLADAGLVGLPNAGKSSLLARLTAARPKVADYPFTTIEPVLGTLEAEDRQLVVADIPGLIEGAAEGAGLGHEFLAHVERTGLIVHVVDVSRDDGPEAYATVREELNAHGGGLSALPELVVLSKVDLVTGERASDAVGEWRGRLGEEALGVIAVSSATGAGISDLRRAVLEAIPEEGFAPATADPGPAPAGFEAEHRVYTPAGDQGFAVERVADGAFRVDGKGIELLVQRHDLTNAEALAYVEQRLREIGVLSELRRKGFEAGDEVRIGEFAFELDPR